MKLVAINLPCHECKTINRLVLSEGSRGKPRCGSCVTLLMEYSVVAGFVYLLSNPTFPGLLKIGFTTRSVEERITELNSSTSVPAPFDLVAYYSCQNPQKDERTVHLALDSCRAPGKEFFAIKPKQALDILTEVLGRRPIYTRNKSATAAKPE